MIHQPSHFRVGVTFNVQIFGDEITTRYSIWHHAADVNEAADTAMRMSREYPDCDIHVEEVFSAPIQSC